MYPVTVKKLRSRSLIGLPHTGDYQQITEAFAKLFETLDARDLTEKTRQMVAIFYDDPSKTAPAMAPSMALPPASIICTATLAASGCDVAHMPLVA